MIIHGTMRKLFKSDALLKIFSRIADVKEEINRCLAKIENSKFFHLILEHKRPVALFLYILWLAGCGYWIYQFMIIDVKPGQPGLAVTDSRDALAILFFGTLGSVFVLFAVFFIIKLIYNLFHDGIESFFSVRWHALVKPASYLVILSFAFSFTGTIKAAGLTAYNQVAGLINTSRQHHMVLEKEIPDDLEKKLSVLMKMIEKDSQE